MKKEISLIISILAIVLSLITIILFFVKVSSNSIVNISTFIGVCTAFIGISVTLIIGYQIINTIQLKGEISELKKRSKDIAKQHEEYEKKLKKQNLQIKEKEEFINEGFELILALIEYNQKSYLSAFIKFNKALIFSLTRTNKKYESLHWVFNKMKNCINNIDKSSFYINKTLKIHGKNINCYEGRELKEIIKDFNKIIEEYAASIKRKNNFIFIKEQYETIIEQYNKKINKIIINNN